MSTSVLTHPIAELLAWAPKGFDRDRAALAILTMLASPRDATTRKILSEDGPYAAAVHAYGRPTLAVSFGYTKIRDSFATAELRGVEFLIPTDDNWPTSLDDLEFPPYGLWAVGNGTLLSAAPRLAVTGHPHHGSQGLITARRFSVQLESAGITIIGSTLNAVGHAAVEGATAHGTRAIIVTAGGVDHHMDNFAGTLRRGGVLVSEQAPTSPNGLVDTSDHARISAALSNAVLVIDAYALDHLAVALHGLTMDRQLLAVPSRTAGTVFAGPTARAGNTLIERGRAIAVETTDEIISRLGALPHLELVQV